MLQVFVKTLGADQNIIQIYKTKLLVEHVIARHGVLEQLLSDRGSNFLVLNICKPLDIKKINISGYHPQTDGLVEKFNSTLIGMLSKSVAKHRRDWDTHLPYLLFAYRTSVQSSTGDSPFFLLYGRDARIPTETVLSQPRTAYQVDMDDYKSELIANMSDARELARKNIESAQSSMINTAAHVHSRLEIE